MKKNFLLLLLFWPMISPAPSVITGPATIATQLRNPATNYIYFAINGNDVSGNGTEARPFATPTNAVARAVAGQTVKGMPGTYNLDTNRLNFPHGVSYEGYGALLYGTRNLITQGVQISPGSDSTLRGLWVSNSFADFNTATYWAAIGAREATWDKAFTNVLVYNLVVTNGFSDNIYIGQSTSDTNRYGIKFYNADLHGYIDVFAVGGTHGSFIGLYNSRRRIDANNDLEGPTSGEACLYRNTSRGHVEMIGCTGYNSNAYYAQTYIANSEFGTVKIEGCNDDIYPGVGGSYVMVDGVNTELSFTQVFWPPTNATGISTINGKTYSAGQHILRNGAIGDGSSLTNVKVRLGTNGVGAVTPNITVNITNQDGSVYEVAGRRIVP